MILSSLLTILLSAAAAAPERPKNAILLLVDGLSWGQLQIALDDARLRGTRLALQDILDAGHTAYCQTAPLGALVVESGAGSSAVSGGRPIANRMLGKLPDGTDVPGILELARRDGKSTGLVTTGRLTHASPAGFLSHMLLRDDEYQIAEQIAASGHDVLLGGGRSYFLPAAVAAARARGAAVLFHEDDLEKSPAGPLLGLLSEDSFPYAIDGESGPGRETVPALERMTKLALERLSRNPKGFVLVVNSRLVDELSHYNDAAGVLAEMGRTDRAAAILRDFARARPDTALVVTTNHDSGGMGMMWQAYPARFGGPDELARMRGQKASVQMMFAEIRRRELAGEKRDAALVRSVVAPKLAPGVVLNDADYDALAKSLSVGPKGAAFTYSPAAREFSRILAPHYLMGWVDGTHTSSAVPCFGMGPGTEALRGLLHHADVSGVLKSALSGTAHQ
ncbi:MAG: alkaline phosphatase [Elusimicrobia bacterium]|nr:alkaline phosphatase [Elusimicrobiota bacterium]